MILTVQDVVHFRPWYEIEGNYYIALESLVKYSYLFTTELYIQGLKVVFLGDRGSCWASIKEINGKKAAYFISLEFLATCILSEFVVKIEPDSIEAYKQIRQTLISGLKVAILSA